MTSFRALLLIQYYVLLYCVINGANEYKEKHIPSAFNNTEELKSFIDDINYFGKFVIELSGIPESDNEDTLEQVRRYAHLIGIADDDLGKTARRIPKWVPEAPGPRIIVVEVRNDNAMQSWTLASYTYRNVTSEDLDKSVPRTEIFVSEFEDLSRCPPSLVKLMYNATRVCAPYGYSKVFVKDGQIYVTRRSAKGHTFIIPTPERQQRFEQSSTQNITSSREEPSETSNPSEHRQTNQTVHKGHS